MEPSGVYKSNGYPIVTPTTTIHSKKTTIHVSNISIDRAALRAHFRAYKGFRRISFHQDYVFVCFSDVTLAANAITQIHSSTTMHAAYAKHGVASNTTPSLIVPPNPILYVSIFPCFGETELETIFRGYEGFDSCRFFPMHALVRFNNLENAKRALEDLNCTTNLFANYSTKGTKNMDSKARVMRSTYQDNLSESAVSIASSNSSSLTTTFVQQTGSCSSTALPKCTIHVTNLDKDLSQLLSLFRTLPGFKRVAFYIDYAFIIFSDIPSASAAIETLLFGSRMKANFARAEYTPHLVPPAALGSQSNVLRVSEYPATTNERDLRVLFESFSGVLDIVVLHSSCVVTCIDVESASNIVESLNGMTNFTCVFVKTIKSAVKNSWSCDDIGDLDRSMSGSKTMGMTDAIETSMYNLPPGIIPSQLTVNSSNGFSDRYTGRGTGMFEVTPTRSNATTPHGQLGSNFSSTSTLSSEPREDTDDKEWWPTTSAAWNGNSNSNTPGQWNAGTFGSSSFAQAQTRSFQSPVGNSSFLYSSNEYSKPEHEDATTLVSPSPFKPWIRPTSATYRKTGMMTPPSPFRSQSTSPATIDELKARIAALESQNAVLRKKKAISESELQVLDTETKTVDYKASYENALNVISELRGEVGKIQEEFETLKLTHESCGYLQGLLAICE